MQQQLKTVVIGNNRNCIFSGQFDRVFSVLLFLYGAALPFEEALATSFGSILRLLGVAIIAYCAVFFYAIRVKVSSFRLLVPFGIWLLMSAISLAWSADFSWWSYFFGIYLLQLVFVFFVIAYYKKLNMKCLENGLLVGATVASAILILAPQISEFTEEGRRTIIIFEQELDPNIVASIIMLGLFICLGRVFSKTNKNLLYKVLIAFLVVGMLFTGSRGALISFVAGFGVLLFLELKQRGSKKRVLIVIILAVIAALIALSYIPEEFLLNRFSGKSLFGIDEYESGVHNRYTIWKHAFELFRESPIVGYGCGNFFDAIETVYRECASHNMYILVLLEEGIIGLLIFGYGLFKIFAGLYKKHLYAPFAMFVSVCIMAMTLDSITTKYFWVSVIIAVVSANSTKGSTND